MDDFLPETLKSAIGEYSQRLINILTPEIYNGFQSMVNESYQICVTNGETNKYLMTFQNCIRRIPKYSQTIIENECNRIIDKSGCNYLEDLLTVTHVILLKNLTTIRVGNRQKKIDISIPKFDAFVHKVYINVGRKIYRNVDLFIFDVPPLVKMKNRRIVENIIEKCILDTIRDNMPFEHIIRSYLDESEEHEEELLEIEQDNEDIAGGANGGANGGGGGGDSTSTIQSDNKNDEYNGPQIIDINANEPVITKVSFDPIPIIHENFSENDKRADAMVPITPKPIRKLHETPSSNDDNRIQFLDNDVISDSDIGDIFDLNTNKLPNANQSIPLLQNGGTHGNGDDINLELSEIDFDAL
jgi:hypothetical protein